MSAPRLLHKVDAPLPEKCRESRFDGGPYIFEAIITKDGDVKDLRTLRRPKFSPPCPEWEAAYHHAIASWHYDPGKFHGKPVPVYLTVTVTIDPR